MRKKAHGRSFRVPWPLGVGAARSSEAWLRLALLVPLRGGVQAGGRPKRRCSLLGVRCRVWEAGLHSGRGFTPGRGFPGVGLGLPWPPWPVTSGPVRSERPWRRAR